MGEQCLENMLVSGEIVYLDQIVGLGSMHSLVSVVVLRANKPLRVALNLESNLIFEGQSILTECHHI